MCTLTAEQQVHQLAVRYIMQPLNRSRHELDRESESLLARVGICSFDLDPQGQLVGNGVPRTILHAKSVGLL